ncbi:MAG: amino acid adenylation domain-containing protein, partial [Acidobacteria bacterium]|nr:amino acid adenylation domain-containing protein [Acidobacteriota bacterium]
DTIAIIENYPLESRLNGENNRLTAASYTMFEATNYDLAIEIKLWQGIEVKFSYAAAAFEPNIIINMASHFRRIIEAIITNPEKEITGIDFLSPEEKNSLLYEFNNTAVSYPGHKCLHQLFMEQASRTPDHVALTALTQIKSITLTYNELNKQSGQWAALLIEKGILVDDIAAIKIERSINLITAIFGILKSGGAYLPIDPGYPQERIDYILKDSGVKILIEMEECRKKIIVNNQFTIFNCQLFMNPVQVSSHSNQLAYIIYTSGSTGKPKGVMIEHRGAVNYILWAVDRYVKNERVNFPLFTSISFDLTVTSIYAPLVSGNSLVIYPQETAANLVEKIIMDNITEVVKLTPTHLQLIRDLKIEKRTNALKRLIVGGEKLSVELAADIYNNFHGQVEIYNEYGPTETVVGSMLYCFDPAKDTSGAVPIGVPAANTRVYILDKHLQLLPPGVPGELVIGGDGVARGYLNNPGLTADKFGPQITLITQINKIQKTKINKSFAGGAGGRFYKKAPLLYQTGDLARWLPDGNMEFLGRIARQVKIRGHRVEPEEIQEQLLKLDGIRETAVVVLENPGGEHHLHAFIAAGNEPSTAGIKAYLMGRLPTYMVPAHFSRLKKIPLTPGGKVDRKRLISMACEGNVTLTGQVPHAAPGTDLEKIIADAWQEILGTDKIGIHDNFFDIGGNSLSLIRLNSQLKKILKKEIPMVTLFDYPTVASLAGYLKGEEAPRPGNENKIAPKGTEVAVIGMAGRFPGAANVHEFWENLQNGLESISFFSKLELKQLGIKAEWVDNPNYVKAKGVLDGIENFDFPFFDYTAREADNMDPQLRLLHECAWTALEDAGYNPGTYDGGIGVYVGSTFNVHWISGLLNKIKS